jgi:hypothetical protein
MHAGRRKLFGGACLPAGRQAAVPGVRRRLCYATLRAQAGGGRRSLPLLLAGPYVLDRNTFYVTL